MVLLWQVNSLVNLSIEAILDGVVNKCPDHLLAETADQEAEDSSASGKEEEGPPPGKKRKVTPTLEFKSNDPVETVRAELDEYLVSSYSQVRQTLVERFFMKYCTGSKVTTDFNHHLYLFYLDCVMDRTFSSNLLRENVTAGTIDNFVTNTGMLTKERSILLPQPIQLLKIILKQSPLLKTLELSFTLPEGAAPIGKTFVSLLGKFTLLTSLRLSFGTKDNCLDFFTSLSHSCPQLIRLHLGKIPFENDQLLALMLGNKRALLSPDFPRERTELINVQITQESLSPICSNLKEFYYNCDENKNICKLPSAALFIRHFRNLEKIQLLSCKHRSPGNVLRKTAPLTILHWHQNQNTGKSARLLENKSIKKSSDELGFIQWTVDAPFIGKTSNYTYFFLSI